MNENDANGFCSESDWKYVESRGISKKQFLSQLEIFEKGLPSMNLLKPCTISDGIVSIEKEEHDRLINLCQEAAKEGRLMKFVPASGAGTRMFSLLHAVSNNFSEESLKNGEDFRQFELFFNKIKNFAFYDELRAALKSRHMDIEVMVAERQYKEIVEVLLASDGLNYDGIAKGLIKFHPYENEECRTPFEEHFSGAADYCADSRGVARIHFTIASSKNNEKEILNHVKTITARYAKIGKNFEITYSNQKSSTDTIAVDMNNRPLKEKDGNLHFRPGGHGALLGNINELKADILFIRNIDNVVPERLQGEVNVHKQILGGYLLDLQDQLFGFLEALSQDSVPDDLLPEIYEFAEKKLSLSPDPAIKSAPKEDQIEFLFSKLNRPLRVCGMVKNQGEPGGGPFWVGSTAQDATVQIVETSQIDLDVPEQKAILEAATHFNPVDIVCGLRDFRGNSFNLVDYVDPDSGFIAYKTKDGEKLKGLELPGLWNGAMAFWNTVFVEVPIFTFNPVKTVFDLLKKEHQP